MSTKRVAHQHGRAPSQLVHTSIHRADSHHELHPADSMQDRVAYTHLEPQHVERAASHPNFSNFIIDAVIYSPIPDGPDSVESMSEDTQRTEPFYHALTTHSNQSAYLSEHSSTLGSGYGLDKHVPAEYRQSEHSHLHTQPYSFSSETHPATSHTSRNTLTAANLHLKSFVEAQHTTPPPTSSPHNPSLSPAQIRYINRYGYPEQEEDNFDFTRYLSAHELFPIEQRPHLYPHTRNINRDSMTFIDGGLLDNDVAPPLLKHVERPYTNVSGHLKQIARRVVRFDGVKKCASMFGGRGRGV
jgi:hypothetical protein